MFQQHCEDAPINRRQIEVYVPIRLIFNFKSTGLCASSRSESSITCLQLRRLDLYHSSLTLADSKAVPAFSFPPSFLSSFLSPSPPGRCSFSPTPESGRGGREMTRCRCQLTRTATSLPLCVRAPQPLSRVLTRTSL